MSRSAFLLSDTNWKTVRDTDYEIAVLPWGATEAHNYHLPYATDVIQCDYIAAEAARQAWAAGARVVVLPTVPFGVNTGQLDIKLCINMNPSTQMAVLVDVVESLAGQGIRKLVILNGHGGNDFKPMIREMQGTHPGMFVSAANWYQLGDPGDIFDEVGDHAGEMETSNLMAIAPDLVLPLEEAGAGAERRFRLRGLRDGTAWAPRRWRRVTDDTGVGNPKLATAEKGRAYLDRVTGVIADYLVELSEADLEELYE